MNSSKEHILEVSFRLFLRKTFKEVTMQEIVKETGLSKGAFYHYFDSKEKLFLEVVKHFSSETDVDYSVLPREPLAQFYHAYVEYLRNKTIYSFKRDQGDRDSGFSLNYFVLIFDAMKLFPDFREKMISSSQEEVGIWTDVVSRARTAGEIASLMTDEQIANLFMYTSDGVVMQSTIQGNAEEAPDRLLSVWDGLYKGLKKD